MKNFGRKSAKRREMIAIFGTSVLILGVLTVTGVYIKNRNDAQNKDGYYIDFDALESEINQSLQSVDKGDDLDYTGTQTEYDYTKNNSEAVQSGSVEKEEKKGQDITENTGANEETAQVPIEENSTLAEVYEESLETTVTDGITVTNTPALWFSEEDSLMWPIVGNILINYSMDKTVYFPTLDQYKYNPALIISAGKGEQVTAAADSLITGIYEDDRLGNVVETDMGNGYSLLYGQLGDVKVSVGQYVSAGEQIGNVGTPTKFFSVEGCNVYLKMTKDDTPVNPVSYLE